MSKLIAQLLIVLMLQSLAMVVNVVPTHRTDTRSTHAAVASVLTSDDFTHSPGTSDDFTHSPGTTVPTTVPTSDDFTH